MHAMIGALGQDGYCRAKLDVTERFLKQYYNKVQVNIEI